MKLDSRILEGKRPLTCLDVEQAREFVGKECIFSDFFLNYVDIEKFNIDNDNEHTGILSINDNSSDYIFINDRNESRYRFILPCEWVKEEKTEPEPKYRVLTLNEFLERFKIGDAIYIRFKKDGAERVVIFSEYNIPPHKDEGNNTESVCLNGIEHHLKSIVCLGMREYNLTTLFDCYEYFDGKEWQPFGILEE